MFFSTEEGAPSTGAPGIGAQATVAICVFGVLWIGIYPPMIIDWANTASRLLMTLF
jgi:NADH:ubiquinone oxidoreductase subunit 2 (subunit N)